MAASLVPGIAPATESVVSWERVSNSTVSGSVTALALADGGRVVIGDERGAILGRVGGSFRRVLRRGPVRDLAVLDNGDLLAGTDHGLYVVSPGGQVALRSPGIGPGARAIAGISSVSGAVALATGNGAFISRAGRDWRPLSESLPSGPASFVGLRERPNGFGCWVVIRGELWTVSLHNAAGVGGAPYLEVGTPQRVSLPGSSMQDAPVAVVFDLAGAEIAVLFATRLVVRAAVESTDSDPPTPAGSPPVPAWRVAELTLPPGAEARHLGFAAGRLWLATDRGLLEATRIEGPWIRAGSPLAGVAVHRIAARSDWVYAAARTGLFVSQPSPAALDALPDSRVSSLPMAMPRDPSIEHVHQRALAYLELRPSRFAALRRGLRRRGWLPIVAIQSRHDRDEDRGRDYDEAFVSGDLRRLNDRDYSRTRDWEMSLSLSWDLGDLAYHPEEIDVSREGREVIELRDDVLDEITQLYFERRRVLLQLAALDAPETAAGPEAIRLRLRAAELAAGIDAWTGGWFSERIALFSNRGWLRKEDVRDSSDLDLVAGHGVERLGVGHTTDLGGALRRRGVGQR